jgi:fructose-1,6-bisphosphatase
LDVHTDNIIFDCLKATGLVYAGISEEQPVLTVLNEEGKYIVTFDPLDGSSIVDCNFTVGSIYAVWPRGDLTQMTAKDMLGAAVSLYGSKTNCIIYN